MKLKIISIIAVIILLFILYFMVYADEVNIKKEKIVTKIIDGDTIIVQGGETVRLIGIDCDERGKVCYQNAKEKIEELLLGKTVTLESDLKDKDIYGRSLRYIFLDGSNINKKLVIEGFCVARFQDDSKYKEEIIKAEELAIFGEVGCKWKSGGF